MFWYKKFRVMVTKGFRLNSEVLRIFFAEFLGTLFLVALGDGAVAQMVLSHNPAVSTFMTVNIAYALAITFALYICGGVSGGHINPAVTLCMCAFGRCDWVRLPVYWAGQFLGAFAGAIVVFITYYDALVAFDKFTLGIRAENHTSFVMKSAGIFGTFPNQDLSVFGAFFDQIIGTAILLLCIFALTDRRNMGVPKHLAPLLIGLVVGVIGMSYGYNYGFAINPARDLAPRLFTLIAGWGSEVFISKQGDFYFSWVPILGQFLGALLGGLIYQLLIGIHWPTSEEVNAKMKANVLADRIKKKKKLAAAAAETRL